MKVWISHIREEVKYFPYFKEFLISNKSLKISKQIFNIDLINFIIITELKKKKLNQISIFHIPLRGKAWELGR